jgi:hypothetical protein
MGVDALHASSLNSATRYLFPAKEKETTSPDFTLIDRQRGSGIQQKASLVEFINVDFYRRCGKALGVGRRGL